MRPAILFTAATLALLALAIAATSCGTRSSPPGSEGNPVRFHFMPLKGQEAFDRHAPKLASFVERTSGLKVRPIAAADFVMMARAFGDGQADIAFMNTLGYLMARDWAKAEARLMLLYGDVYRTYQGEFLVRADGPIQSPADLGGKAILFSDPFSASGYLYPLKYLADHRIRPATTSFASGHREAVQMLYDGRADAVATYHARPGSNAERDARAEIARAHPDVFAKLRIIALTDEIPNGPVALRHDLPPDVKAKLVGALLEFARTPEGREALLGLYNATGFAIASDADYDGVQGLLRQLGTSVEEVVPGGVTFYRTRISPLLEN